MCKVLEVSKSGFYHWNKKQIPPCRQRDKMVLIQIKESFELSKKTYGSRRILQQLKQWGVCCHKKQVERLMRENGIQPKIKRKFRPTTDSKHSLRISPNLLNRNFLVEEMDKWWVGDITYIWTKEGWLYLSTVIDLCSKKVVGYSLDKRITKQLVMNSMLNAITSRKPAPGLCFHSDRGSQYASDEFRKILADNGITQSMSRKGNCWDNAVAESFFKTIKSDMIYRNNFKSRKEAELKIFEYIEMLYNTKRLHSSNNYMSPVQFERSLSA